ncbi:isoflavone reductase-like protein [Aristolochia californica]|uniref:isoflavone reductase-like protein n=1 Tax=Aristolochia californica TaxID=171875 RepID=UPI0035E2B66E
MGDLLRSSIEKSKILIIGGTGYIGQFIVRAALKNTGVTLLKGDLNNQKSLVKIAISTVGTMQELEQLKIIAAFKEAEIRSSVVLVKEEDIGAYTIKAADDLRTLNKILYIRPPANTYSFNEIVSLWEMKIGKALEKIYVPEEQVLKNIEDLHKNSS